MLGTQSSSVCVCVFPILLCTLPLNYMLYCDHTYVCCLQESSPHERAIKRDLNRTFPEHSFFKERDGLGQESLLNVLMAYSVYDKEVGYCQGSPFIVGLLLMQVGRVC